MIGYYASVKDGRRTGLLLGPFPTHEQALDCVPVATKTAEANNPRAVFYAYGTCKITTKAAPADDTGEYEERLMVGTRELPAGVLNEIVKNGEGVTA